MKISELPSGGSARGTDRFVVARDGANVSLELRDIQSLIPAGQTGPEGPPGLPGDAGPAGPPGTTSWAGITDKPSTFPHAPHAHAISDVTGLQAALDAAGGGSPNLSGAWPIGSVFFSALPTNPATLLGFGTWVAFGAGRMPVGFAQGDPDFGTLLGTGGAKTHTLTVNEIPSHSHVVTSQTATTGSATSYEHGTLDTSSAEAEATEVTGTTGGGAAHNNLPPFVVVHIWQRTA